MTKVTFLASFKWKWHFDVSKYHRMQEKVFNAKIWSYLSQVRLSYILQIKTLTKSLSQCHYKWCFSAPVFCLMCQSPQICSSSLWAFRLGTSNMQTMHDFTTGFRCSTPSFVSWNRFKTTGVKWFNKCHTAGMVGASLKKWLVEFCRHKIVHIIYGDAWDNIILRGPCVYFFALNVTGAASESQIPQRGEEVFHLFLKEAIAVFRVLTGSFRVSQFDLKHSFSFSLLLHLLLKSLHLRTQGCTWVFQPVEGRTQAWVNTNITSNSYLCQGFSNCGQGKGLQFEREKKLLKKKKNS